MLLPNFLTPLDKKFSNFLHLLCQAYKYGPFVLIKKLFKQVLELFGKEFYRCMGDLKNL